MSQKKGKRRPVWIIHRRVIINSKGDGSLGCNSSFLFGFPRLIVEGDRFDIRDFFLSWEPSGLSHWFTGTLEVSTTFRVPRRKKNAIWARLEEYIPLAQPAPSINMTFWAPRATGPKFPP